MAFNRVVDRDLDKQNPRTRQREIPAGIVSSTEITLLIFLSAAVFFIAAWQLGEHCLFLAPFVLGVLFGYSWTKRFTSAAHLVLGVALALAPGGVWYALTAEFAWQPLILMTAVLFWVAGFDIIYACQDLDFDHRVGLYSIPTKLGLSKALALAKILHFLAAIFLVSFGYVFQLGIYYYFGIFLFSACLVSQHQLVSSDDLSQIDRAFFNKNGSASFVFLIAVLTDLALFSS